MRLQLKLLNTSYTRNCDKIICFQALFLEKCYVLSNVCLQQASVPNPKKVEFDDPLRAHTGNVNELYGLHVNHSSLRKRQSKEVGCFSTKEWAVFSSSLVRRFSGNHKISISLVGFFLPLKRKNLVYVLLYYLFIF